MKIAVNRCFGGFSVSRAVFNELGLKWNPYNSDFDFGMGILDNKDFGIISDNPNAYRAAPRLIEAIEKIGCEKVGGGCAKIEVVEIPDDVDWEIDEYDGSETIREKHRSW